MKALAARPRWAFPAVLLLWLLCAVSLVYSGRGAILSMNLIDTDDALRLVEVRDWMAGQSWFDVTQYRILPPTGAPMHWSRLVDIPIAGFIRIFSLFTAQGWAERLALCAVPLLLLLGLFVILYRLTIRVTGRALTGVVAAAMLASSLGILIQFQALRIDHHGWQIVLGALTMLLTLEQRDRALRSGLLPGLVMASSLVIALESLPLAIAIGGIFALRYLCRGEDRSGLAGYLVGLSGGASILVLATLGWRHGLTPWCDSFSPAYLIPLAATLLAVMAGRFVPQGFWWQRLLLLALAAAAGAACFWRFSHQCLAGPFSTLDPIVYSQWYANVAEGMPIWAQTPDITMLVVIPGVLGLVGTALAVRFDGAARRTAWTELLIAQGAAFIVSLVVMRAMGIAQLLALPGTAWLFLSALQAAMRQTTPVKRVLLGFGCFALVPIGAEVLATAMLPADKAAKGGGYVCPNARGIAWLNALPPATLFAPLDSSPYLLAYTPHNVIGTGHHRNRTGMVAVIRGFISPPDQAHAIIAATSARYLAICTAEKEASGYARRFPGSLAAMLVAGHAPQWLQPVYVNKRDIHVYRIVRPDQVGTKRSATPFMQ